MEVRRRLDEIADSTRIATGFVWLAAGSLFSALCFYATQIYVNRPAEPTPVFIWGIAVSGILTTFVAPLILIWTYQCLRYTSFPATIVLTTERPAYAPGDQVEFTLSIESERALRVESGEVRIRKVGESGFAITAVEAALRAGHASPGARYESSMTLDLPRLGEGLSTKDAAFLTITVATAPRTNANLSARLYEGPDCSPDQGTW